ncbi:MAG: DUF1080 domain-containing protein [Armatimonadetes bacterium]|nr:DUF1080 domain-containing protein [Armatimonadota bacterium]
MSVSHAWRSHHALLFELFGQAEAKPPINCYHGVASGAGADARGDQEEEQDMRLALLLAATGVALGALANPSPAAPKVKNLIGKDLTGWRLHGERNGWKVENGVLINTPPSSDLYTEEKFKDFELHYEFNVPSDGNSGLYLRGRYEIQILDDFGRPPSPGGNGSVYSLITAQENASKPAGQWQSVDVKLAGKRVTVVLNGKTIIADRELTGPTPGGLDDEVDESGPILLQGNHGPIQFRNIHIKLLKSSPSPETAAPARPVGH